MNERGYRICCPKCKYLMPRSAFTKQCGGVHRKCITCRDAERYASSDRRKAQKTRETRATIQRKETVIDQIKKEFSRETYLNHWRLKRLKDNKRPTRATTKSIEARTKAQEKWQTALDEVSRRVEAGENLTTIQDYFEEEP